MKTVRQRVLEFIRSQRAVTVSELRQAFRMSEQNVRYHLSILADQGLIEVIGLRPAPEKGRPAKIFGPSDRSYGDNLDILASAMLHLVLKYESSQDRSDVLNELASVLAERMGNALCSDMPQLQKSGHLSSQLNRLTQILNHYHYHSRWEAHSDSPRLVLGRCPYTAVIDDHPSLCQMDEKIIALLLGKPVEQTAKLKKDKSGLLYCMFRVRVERV